MCAPLPIKTTSQPWFQYLAQLQAARKAVRK